MPLTVHSVETQATNPRTPGGRFSPVLLATVLREPAS